MSRHRRLLAATLSVLSLGGQACAATPERVDAAPVQKRAVAKYAFVPMLLVTHSNGGDALAQEPLDRSFVQEPFTTLINTTHAGAVESGSYWHLPMFDIYATADLVPHAGTKPWSLDHLKAQEDGYMLVQFTTPNCPSCDALTQTLAQWMDAHPAHMRWIAVDLSPSNLRGCWNGYRFVVSGWNKKKPSAERAECLKSR